MHAPSLIQDVRYHWNHILPTVRLHKFIFNVPFIQNHICNCFCKFGQAFMLTAENKLLYIYIYTHRPTNPYQAALFLPKQNSSFGIWGKINILGHMNPVLFQRSCSCFIWPRFLGLPRAIHQWQTNLSTRKSNFGVFSRSLFQFKHFTYSYMSISKLTLWEEGSQLQRISTRKSNPPSVKISAFGMKYIFHLIFHGSKRSSCTLVGHLQTWWID